MFYIISFDPDVSAPLSINDADLFFGSLLLKVDWEEYFDTNYPAMANWKKTYVRRISETSSINPLILLSSIMVEEKVSTGDIKPKTPFDLKLKRFAKSLIKEYYKHDGSNEFGYTNATFAVWKTFKEDNAKLAAFLVIYDLLKSKLKNTLETLRSIRQPAWRTENSDATRRSTEEELAWPFPSEECWDLSK